jgi:hypothetical protein
MIISNSCILVDDLVDLVDVVQSTVQLSYRVEQQDLASIEAGLCDVFVCSS